MRRPTNTSTPHSGVLRSVRPSCSTTLHRRSLPPATPHSTPPHTPPKSLDFAPSESHPKECTPGFANKFPRPTSLTCKNKILHQNSHQHHTSAGAIAKRKHSHAPSGYATRNARRSPINSTLIAIEFQPENSG